MIAQVKRTKASVYCDKNSEALVVYYNSMNYFLILSARFLPALNFTTFFAGILMVLPV